MAPAHRGVGNVANALQFGMLVVALVWWINRHLRSRITVPADGAVVRLLRLLALLLPARDRFVGEVMANLADRQRW
jgi:hypothetical protein